MTEPDLSAAQTLATLPMFAGLDDVGLWHVSELANVVEVPAGHVLMQPGQEGSGLFVIVDGRATVELPGGTTVDCSEGEFIGELSLLDSEPRSASVTAVDRTLLFRLAQDDFYSLMSEQPLFTRAINRALCKIIRNS